MGAPNTTTTTIDTSHTSDNGSVRLTDHEETDDDDDNDDAHPSQKSTTHTNTHRTEFDLHFVAGTIPRIAAISCPPPSLFSTPQLSRESEIKVNTVHAYVDTYVPHDTCRYLSRSCSCNNHHPTNHSLEYYQTPSLTFLVHVSCAVCCSSNFCFTRDNAYMYAYLNTHTHAKQSMGPKTTASTKIERERVAFHVD